MKLIDIAIKKPVTVAVGVILILLFGIISLFRIPIQLTPDIDVPEISVETVWRGASPQEVEREIIDEQEDQLKNVEGLEKMKSESSDGRGYINLLFELGTDPDTALLKVSNKLEQVKKYPRDVDKPTIKSGGRHESAIAWMVLQAKDGYQGELIREYDFCDKYVKPRLERISGVASVNIYGGQERELQVVADPDALAARNVTIPELMQALDIENKNISAGNFDEEKRRYIVRTVGEYESPADVESVIVKRISGVPIKVGDVAMVSLAYGDRDVVVRHDGKTTIVLNAVRETGSNVLVVMNRLNEALCELNEGIVGDHNLEIEQVYDETNYIYDAIRLVKQNILVGGCLAVVVLFLFLRNVTSTVIIALAIPISVVGTFLMLTLFGRNINVVSLAGMSFAVGLVVDNSIVVFENIFRHREMGKNRRQAAYDGTVEVWGAVSASTLTTVAVFVPIVFIREEAGQLFRDIAIAISSAVGLSLVISMTMIPSLSAKILGRVEKTKQKETDSGKLRSVHSAATRIADWISGLVYRICGRVSTRVLTVLVMTSLSVGMAWFLAPKTEYLPEGNRDIVFGILLPPPGYNLTELEDIAMKIEKDVLPLTEIDPESEEAANLPVPPVRNFFYVAFGQQIFMGIVSAIPERTRELIDFAYGVLGKIPGMIPFVQQPSLFSEKIGEGRSIEIEITGPDMNRLIMTGRQIFGRLLELMPEAQIRPIPSLDLGNPEMRVIPNRDRLTRLGITTSELGRTIDVLVDGAIATEYQIHGEEIDLVVKGKDAKLLYTQDLEGLTIQTPRGERVTLGSLADIRLVDGPAQINHIESQRAIALQVVPPPQVPLEDALDTITEEVVEPIRATGELGNLYRINLSGTADDLIRTKDAFKWNFLLALLISYLLMSALFENFLYPAVIMFSVPLAAAGGFMGLALVNLFVAYQPLDIITMLGFIILLGVVVNNAILIVHQALNNMRQHDMPHREAIRESVRSRLRPIYMSAITSIFGMLPLILTPGAGSEFYRGIGSVVVGGLAVSTFFTLFLVPALFSLVMDATEYAKQIKMRKFS